MQIEAVDRIGGLAAGEVVHAPVGEQPRLVARHVLEDVLGNLGRRAHTLENAQILNGAVKLLGIVETAAE